MTDKVLSSTQVTHLNDGLGGAEIQIVIQDASDRALVALNTHQIDCDPEMIIGLLATCVGALMVDFHVPRRQIKVLLNSLIDDCLVSEEAREH